jgi:hypothetical protein
MDISLGLALMAWPKPDLTGHEIERENSMKKALISLAAIAMLAASMFTTTPADARCGGCGVGLGVVGGLAAGAIIGGAIANSYGPAYAPGPGYVAYGGYGAPYPVACPGGYWARRPIAFDAYGNPIRWSRARFICP